MLPRMSTPDLAARMSRLGTETAFEVLAKARALEAQGQNVVHLEIGEPDFDTPAHIVQAAQQALAQGFTHYGPSPGLPPLREAIAEDFSRRRGVAVKPEQVVVYPGDVMVGDEDGVVCVPAEMAGEVAEAAKEQEELEAWLGREIANGRPLRGTYPPDAATRERYHQQRSSG